MTSNKRLDLGANADHDPDPGIFSGNFYLCGTEGDVGILRDQLPWRRFAVSEYF